MQVVPNILIPENQKDETYHKNWLNAILYRAIVTGYIPNSYTAMSASYDFYNSDYSIADKYPYLQGTNDGKSLPAKWRNYNMIRNKVELLVGEAMTRGYDFSCQTVGRDAVTRKMMARAQVAAAMYMRDLYEEGVLDAEAMNVTFPKDLPRDEEELNYYMKNKYKENLEEVMLACLKSDALRMRYKMMRMRMLRDLFISGRIVTKCDVINGIPETRVIDPRQTIIDPISFDDMMSNAQFIGDWQYYPVAKAAEMYGLTTEEIQEVARAGAPMQVWFGANYNNLLYLEPFNLINNVQHVLVVNAEWRDTKQVRVMESTDKYGNKHIKMLNEEDKVRKRQLEDGTVKIKEVHIENIRRGTLIGGGIIKNWGEVPNQPRSIDNPSASRFSYTVVSHAYINFKTVSKSQEIESLQEFKDLLMYRIEVEISTAGRKGFTYDLRYKPSNLALDDVLYYLKTAGIAFINSTAAEGNDAPVGSNMFTPFDTSLTSAINTYIELANYVDGQAQEITGINNARSGFQKASSLVGVTQAAISQSSFMTEGLMITFNEFENAMWQRHAEAIKVTWPFNKEKYANIIGNMGVDILFADEDMRLQDYAIYVETRPEFAWNMQQFQGVLASAWQTGQLTGPEYMMLINTNDVREGVKKYMVLMERKEAMAAQAAQEQAAMEQEAISQKAQIAEMQDNTKKEMQRERIEAQGQRSANDIRLKATQAEIDTQLRRMELQIKAMQAEQKANANINKGN